jgi:poly(3-hydroxyalkanoate) depolymerase
MSADLRSQLGEECVIAALGQQIHVSIRRGHGVPLVLCNGIGSSLEVLDPLVARLNPDTTVVRFDAPGTGLSPNSRFPYGFPYLAAMLRGVLDALGLDRPGGQVDILGFSWGGALAQQFAFQYPHYCRRLILVSTGTGVLMVPGGPRALARMLTPRRFVDPDYAASIAGDLYGGTVRTAPSIIHQALDRQLRAASWMGYLHQLLAGSVWTSLFTLPMIRQSALIIAGTDDPIIPFVNARIMGRLMPHATVHAHAGGHVEIITNAEHFGRVIEEFRHSRQTEVR